MKQVYSLFCFFLFFTIAQTGHTQLLTFCFAGSDGDEATWPSASNQTNIDPSAITRGPGINAAAHADRFNSMGWTTSPSINLSDYLEITLTPKPGFRLDLTSFQLQHQRSTTGPTRFVIRTNLDSYAGDATNVVSIGDVNTFQSHSFSFLSPISSSAAVTLRIYGYAAESPTGTWGPGVGATEDMGAFGSMNVLPVKLANMKAAIQGKDIQILWTNLEEKEVSSYTVEYSKTGKRFSVVSSFKPKANNGSKADYRVADQNPTIGFNFYRIKVTEANGKVLYSPTFKVYFSTSSTSVSLFPNPVVGNKVNLQAGTLPAGDYTVKIYTIDGQIISNEILKHRGGSFSQLLLLPNIEKGVYYLEVNGVEKRQTQFIVQ